MKYSKQREQIKTAVLEHPVHPTADMVYAMLKVDNPSLSLGTVYRNLRQLAQNGVLMQIGMPNASDRFDGRCEPHCHMVCSCCGEVVDAPEISVPLCAEQITARTGFVVTGHQLLLHGICKDCYAAAQQPAGDLQ